MQAQLTWGSSPVGSSSTVQRMARRSGQGNGRVGEHLAANDPQARDNQQPAENGARGGRPRPADPSAWRIKKHDKIARE